MVNAHARHEYLLPDAELVRVIIKGDLPAVEFLLDMGADINFSGRNGITALIYAATIGHFDITKLLLDRGAHIDDCDTETRCTSLDWAAGTGHYDIVELLISRGANIDIVNGKGCTVLQSAERIGDTYMAALIKEGRLTKSTAKR